MTFSEFLESKGANETQLKWAKVMDFHGASNYFVKCLGGNMMGKSWVLQKLEEWTNSVPTMSHEEKVALFGEDYLHRHSQSKGEK